MNRHNALGSLAAFVLLGATWAAATGEGYELNLRFMGLAPAKSDDWSSVVGGEGQIRLWGPENLGLAFAIGGQRWDAPDEYGEFVDELGWFSVDISGDVTLVPVGISIVARNDARAALRVVGEAGVRYAWTDSSIRVVHTFEEGKRLYYEESMIDIDDVVLGVLSLEIGAQVGYDMWLGGGVGYQFSLSQPRESINGIDLGSTGFDGFKGFIMLAIGF